MSSAGRIASLAPLAPLAPFPQLARAASPADILLGRTCDAGQAEFALIARVQQAWFERVNAAGGIRGRPIRTVSLDDGGDPARARGNLRELDATHRALALFGMPATVLGEAAAMPQLFVRDRLLPPPNAADRALSTALVTGFYPSLAMEGRLLAKRLLERPAASRIAVMYRDDAAGRALLDGVRAGLAGQADPLLARDWPSGASPAVALRALQAGGADALVLAIEPAATLLALDTLRAQAWMPRRWVPSECASVLPAAAAAQRGGAADVESLRYLLDAHDPGWSTRRPFRFEEFSRWDNDRGVQAYTQFLKRRLPGVPSKSELVEYACSAAQLMVQVLVQCRDRLTRENVARQALRLAGVDLPLLSPGIRIYTHPGRSAPITQGQPVRFDGAQWVGFGEVLDADED